MKRILTLFVVLTVVLGFWQSSLGAGRRPPATEDELKNVDKGINQEPLAGSEITKSENNEKLEKLKEIKNQLEKKFNTKIDVENIAIGPNFVPKVFLTDEKELIKETSDGVFKKERKLIFLNEDGSVKKEMKLIRKYEILAKDSITHNDTISDLAEKIKFSKTRNLISIITTSFEGKKSSWEGMDIRKIVLYSSEGQILWSKDIGFDYKFPLREILFSNDDENFVLYYYSPESGLEWLEFYDKNGNKINEYQPPREWESLDPVVTTDNYLLMKSVIVKGPPSSRKEVNLKIDFQGNIVEKGK